MFVGVAVSIVNGVIIFLLGLVIGIYSGYRIAGFFAVLAMQTFDFKKMKWEESIFAYRPKRFSDNLRPGDVISFTLTPDLANIFNGIARLKEKNNEV